MAAGADRFDRQEPHNIAEKRRRLLPDQLEEAQASSLRARYRRGRSRLSPPGQASRRFPPPKATARGGDSRIVPWAALRTFTNTGYSALRRLSRNSRIIIAVPHSHREPENVRPAPMPSRLHPIPISAPVIRSVGPHVFEASSIRGLSARPETAPRCH